MKWLEERARKQEAEANQFAIELLMPESFVLAEIEKLGGRIDLCDDKAIVKLAKIFQVPTALMAIRIGQVMGLTAKPCTRKGVRK